MRQYTIGLGLGETADRVPITSFERNCILGIIKSYLLKQFGGYTAVQTEGAWTNPNGEAVCEEGMSFSVITRYDADAMREVAEKCGQYASQYYVALIHPGGEAEILECPRSSLRLAQ